MAGTTSTSARLDSPSFCCPPHWGCP